jgi:TonB-dependent SusC/RagA subfamily outer membrane receptor
MTAAWIVYGLLVGVLVACAAAGAEGALRLARRPVRWVWPAALALLVALVALAPARAPVAPLTPLRVPAVVPAERLEQPGEAGAEDGRTGIVARYRGEALREVQVLLARAVRLVPAWVERFLVAGWLLGGLVVLLALAGVHARLHRLRKRWPIVEVEGIRVRVAPGAGPAVMGLRRPEVVVPAWLLRLEPDARRAILAHEHEHVRARDPLVLLSGWLLLAALPWHPAAWWMLSRLRLALELDCDARVLRRGVSAASYGAVLIDVAGRRPGLRVGVVAGADETSHLERRLLAMTPRPVRFAPARAAGLGILALASLLAACEATLPSAADVDAMDAAAVETAARRATLIAAGDPEALFTLDGVEVTVQEAESVPPEDIAWVRVLRAAEPGEPARIHIITREREAELAEALPEGVVEADEGLVLRSEGGMQVVGYSSGPGEEIRVRLRSSDAALDGVQPLFIIDGVPAAPSAAGRLQPDRIESISVLKGPAATTAYGEEGKNGVVVIVTKGTPAPDGGD